MINLTRAKGEAPLCRPDLPCLDPLERGTFVRGDHMIHFLSGLRRLVAATRALVLEVMDDRFWEGAGGRQGSMKRVV
jgi:hypothetical protein